jgi:APA family basic amino acid/polyamine antiporter
MPMAKGQLFARKTVANVQEEFNTGELKRTLGPANLVSLGVGCIIGAGIFVLTGQAAANFAGPAVVISFVIAGLACTFAGLCYAELASTMPVPGSAYTYCYVTLGEVFAWTMGWLLLLEYGVAASTVAAGWTGYVAGNDNTVGLLQEFGINIPTMFKASTLQFSPPTDPVTGLAIAGAQPVLQAHPTANIVGAAGIMAVTLLLVLGVHESAQVNNVIVAIKVTVLVAFAAIGAFYIDPANWTPFIPENEGGFKYGVQGVLRAASVIFFAYVGFEAVSTAAGEARNPQKDLPLGILGSLFICTAIYIVVAMVMTGVVPFRELGGGAPIAIAIDRMDPAWARVPWALNEKGELNLLTLMIKIGAFTGLTSVMLVLSYAQTRVFYQMAKDGLVPSLFSRLNARFRTPAVGTLLLGTVIAIAAAVLPLSVLGDMVSLGTALAFAIVCISVMYLRRAHPDLARPFKVPFYPVTPILGIFFCVVLMMGPILLDIVSKATGVDILGEMIGAPGQVDKDPVAFWILVTYAVLGVLIYAFYGYRNSKITHGAAAQAAE